MIGFVKRPHGKLRLPWVTLGLGLFSLGLYAVFGGTPEGLVYDRSKIQGGEWWRLVTGHLVHLDLQHFAYNVGALIALGLFYETAAFGSSSRAALVFFLGILTVTGTLFMGYPATAYYAGLSALLNALYAVTTIGMWHETGRRFWLLLFGLDIAKITWEAAFAPIFSSGLAWPPHIGAHIAGVTTGTLLAFVWILKPTTLRPQSERPYVAPRHGLSSPLLARH